jgi:hypothetical protein
MQTLAVAAVLVSLINGACILAAAYTQHHYWFYAMFAIAATGLTTFFGILIQDLRSGTDKRVSSESMRLAIARLITTTYIATLAYLLFVPPEFKLAAVAETLLTNFTAVVGTLVAFFFGSAAYIEARTKQKKDQDSEGNRG